MICIHCQWVRKRECCTALTRLDLSRLSVAPVQGKVEAVWTDTITLLRCSASETRALPGYTALTSNLTCNSSFSVFAVTIL